MIRKIDIYVLTIVCTMLTIFAVISAATVTAPPASISNLHMNSGGTNYIDWGWSDPSTSDFNHVDVYINGVFKASVLKGIKHYNATSLVPSTVYTIGIHTIDNYGNIGKTLKTNIQSTGVDTVSNIVRFMTVGDPHITSNINADPYKRLARAINYINNRSDVDFVVITGDIVDSATTNNFVTAKTLMSRLKKPYYIISGNHDLGSSISKFEGYFGPAERVVNMNGYQFIFVGISKDSRGVNHWSFDYSRADKSKPTVIFNHGPVQQKGKASCISGWGSYYGYSCDMKSKVDSFTKLLGYYDGHVHVGTNILIRGERYVTADNLGGYGVASKYIGYTIIQNNVLKYSLVHY